MKKTLCLIFSLMLILSLCACGSDAKGDAASDSVATNSDSDTDSNDDSQENKDTSKEEKKSKKNELSMEALLEHPVTPADQFEYRWVTVKHPDGTFSDDGKEITKYLGKDDIVVLPEEVDGVPIRRLGQDVFDEKSSVKAVKISDSITEISGSFQFNQNLRYVALGKNVEYIKNHAFYSCDNIEEVVLNEGLYAIEENAFASMTIKSIYVPDSVQEIDPIAFYGTFENGGVIRGKSGSTIETYCQENGYPFEVVE